MKSCSKCGNSLDSKLEFCNKCGAMVKHGFAHHFNHATGDNLKAIASSRFFLVAIIAFSASVFFSMINGLFNSSYILGAVYEAAEELGLAYLFYEYIGVIHSFATSGNVLGGIFNNLPSLLIAAGLWITYASAINNDGQPLKTIGLSLIKIISVITIVVIGLGLVFAEILFIVLLILLANSYNTEGAVISVILLMVFAPVLTAFIIFYFTRIIKTLNAGISLSKGTPTTKRFSRLVMIFCFIGAVLSLMNGFSALSDADYGIPFAICTFFINISQGIYLWIFGAIIKKLRQN